MIFMKTILNIIYKISLIGNTALVQEIAASCIK